MSNDNCTMSADHRRRVTPMIEMKDVVKIHDDGQGGSVAALDGLDITIDTGEFVAAVGPSGSGKSTFLGIAGCLDAMTSGDYRLGGLPIAGLDHDQLAWLRTHHFGFVFQSFQLLNHRSVLDNVMQPMIYARTPRRQRRDRAMACLARVGLAELHGRHPHQLSGGQQQRVAIARALANQPSILLADEPTAALDPSSKAQVLDVIEELNDGGITVILVTHDVESARRAHRQIHFRAGRAANSPTASRALEDVA